IAFCTVTLFPVRVLGALICLLLGSLFAALATACLKDRDLMNVPLTGIRNFFHFSVLLSSSHFDMASIHFRALKRPIQFFARGCLFFFGFHWVKVKGKLVSEEEAPILVCAPHSSFVDALALSVICLPGGVSRKENEDIPIIGGAFYAACPVQPIVIKYPNKLDTVTWTWSGPSAIKLFWLTLCQFHNYMEIEILPVYKPSCEESNDAKLFARNVRVQMASALNIPITEHTYEDCRLMLEASQNKLPAAAGLVEYQKISTKLCVRLESMKDLLHKFAEIDTNADGRVDLKEFAAYLNLPVTPHVEGLFSLFDRDDSGYVDFREYIIGMALVAKPANSDEAIKMAFEMFDVNKDGRVTELELKHILQSAYPSIRELDVNCIFKRIDANNQGSVTFEEFYEFAKSHPEYAVIFHSHKSEEPNEDTIGETNEGLEGTSTEGTSVTEA
ncbi:hypothetical protein QZH41_011829, partial [Actinostola sp. cb2023]